MKKKMVFAILIALLASSAARAGEWYEKIKLGGDFRHRYELIQDDSKDADRHRMRIRMRLAMNAEILEGLTVGARFATGSDDPVSTNQTLTDAFTTKGWHLDRAFFKWQPVKVKGLSVTGGKMGLPFMIVEGTDLIWDGDLSPEGIAAGYKGKASERVEIIISTAYFNVMERKSETDTYMGGGQAGMKIDASDETWVSLGAGYYDYEHIKNYEALYDGGFFGNSSMDDGGEDVFSEDYKLAEAFGEFGFKHERISLVVYGDYVNNTSADSLNTGYLIGATFKHGKDKGSIKLYGNYRKLEADAVLGVFTDSDFCGGGTDGKGWKVGASYALANKVSLGGTLFINKKGIEEEAGYTRFQFDLQMKF